MHHQRDELPLLAHQFRLRSCPLGTARSPACTSESNLAGVCSYMWHLRHTSTPIPTAPHGSHQTSRPRCTTSHRHSHEHQARQLSKYDTSFVGDTVRSARPYAPGVTPPSASGMFKPADQPAAGGRWSRRSRRLTRKQSDLLRHDRHDLMSCFLAGCSSMLIVGVVNLSVEVLGHDMSGRVETAYVNDHLPEMDIARSCAL
jgi:hypothetical protein